MRLRSSTVTLRRALGLAALLGASPVLCGCGGPSSVAHPAGSRHLSSSDGSRPVFALFEPHCPRAPSLETEFANYRHQLGLAANASGLTLVDVTPQSLRRALNNPPLPFVFATLAGHGMETQMTSAICASPTVSTAAGPVGTPLPIDELARLLRRPTSGAVFVVNSCLSAHVDPRESSIPLSVISASPLAVNTDSLFGSVLPTAITAILADPNCDGLLTDQELYDELLFELSRRPPLSEHPAYPKLRRNASSEIPLPIRPHHDQACAAEARATRATIERASSTWGELGEALRLQLTLTRAVEHSEPAELPRTAHDYFVIAGTMASASAAAVTTAAEAAGLVKLPTSATRYARSIARFGIATQIYEFTERCGWISIIRLKDDKSLATRRLSDLNSAIPRRDSIESPPNGVGPLLRRTMGFLQLDKTQIPVPCYGGTGQCFRLAEPKASPAPLPSEKVEQP